MRLVIYTRHMVPVHIIEMDDWELEVLGQHGPLMVGMPENLACDRLTGRGLTLEVRLGRFTRQDGSGIPFLVLGTNDGLGLLATDVQGGMVDWSATAQRFRKEFSYRLAAMLRDLEIDEKEFAPSA
jgi:hypothetical protein